MKKLSALLLLIFTTSVFSQSQVSYKEIDSLLLRGRYKDALKILENSEDSFHKNHHIASIYYQLDKTKKAIEYYQKALSIRDDYRTKVKIGKAYQKLKKHNEAILIFEKIVQKDPQNLLIKYQLGKLYLIKRKANKAIKIFEELYAVDKSNPNYSYQKGIAYAMKKSRDKMINSFLEAYSVDSTHVKSLFQLANSFAKLRDKDSTFLFLNKGLQLEPNHVSLNKLKATQLFKQKEYLKTIDVLNKLDSIMPQQAFLADLYGRSYFNLGVYEKAKEYFERSKELDPNDYKTLTLLGHVYMKLEKYQKAKFQYFFATSLARKERLDEEYYGIAMAEIKLNKMKEAIRMLEKAVIENRYNYRALYQLAKTSDDYYADKKKAYKHYDKYLMQFDRKDPDLTAYAKRRVKEIKKDYFLRGEKLED